MRQLTALLLACLLLTPLAVAEEAPWATYALPVGAEVAYITDAAAWQAPRGLEAMYALMTHTNVYGDSYLMRMPNGRALVSVSCTPVTRTVNAQELRERWPQMVEALEAGAVQVKSNGQTVRVEEWRGFETLHVKAELAIGQDGALPIQAEGFAFTHNDEMIEIWLAHPTVLTYLFDDEAEAELKNDRAAAKAFLDSLDFPNDDTIVIDSVPYRDPQGHFSLQMIRDSVVLTPRSSSEERAAVKARYVAANADGAQTCFDHLMAQIDEEGMTAIFTPDMQGVIELTCAPTQTYVGATAEELASLGNVVGETLKEHYGIVLLMQNDMRQMIDNVEHAMLTYWLRDGKYNVQMDVLVCVANEDRLCEADVFVTDGNADMRDILHALLTQTLHYHEAK